MCLLAQRFCFHKLENLPTTKHKFHISMLNKLFILRQYKTWTSQLTQMQCASINLLGNTSMNSCCRTGDSNCIEFPSVERGKKRLHIDSLTKCCCLPAPHSQSSARMQPHLFEARQNQLVSIALSPCLQVRYAAQSKAPFHL